MATDRHRSDGRHMTLRHHFQELSRRFLIIVVILLLASSLVYVFRSTIVPIILQPLTLTFGDQKLMFLNPAGGFNFIFFISIYIGIAAAAPFVVQQIYAFIRPTLPKAAQRLSAKIIISSTLLLIAGILFGYYVAVPGALKFLVEFAGEYVSAALTADSYLHFLIAYTLGLGLLFQIPFILIIGHYIKPFTPGGLLNTERWAIVLIMIAAAIITPTPDPINLMIVAIPILLVYQLGVIMVLMSIYKKKRAEAKVSARERNKKPAETARKVIVAPEVAVAVQQVIAPAVNISVPRTPPVSHSIDGFRRNTRQTSKVVIPHRKSLEHGHATVKPMPQRPVGQMSPSSLRRYMDGVSVMLPQ